MQPAIQIDHEGSRVYDAAATIHALSACRPRLPGAEVRYWATPPWQVVEQGYDLPDVYVSYLEITTANNTDIPIRCLRHDLYGFYVLAGGIRIAAANQQQKVPDTAAGYYRLSYLPAASYSCRFNAGRHHLFYFVAKDRVLFREPSPELSESLEPVEALRAKLGIPAVSARLPLAGVANDAIRRFLHHPGSTYLRRYISIQVLMITLLLQACKALRVQSATGQVGAVFAQRMRDYIDKGVAHGDDIDTATVARAIGLSYAYAKVIFRKHVGQPVGGYIRTRKLEQARRMLEAGDTPAQVARYVCWTYGHFNKAFKARYGVSPSTYR